MEEDGGGLGLAVGPFGLALRVEEFGDFGVFAEVGPGDLAGVFAAEQFQGEFGVLVRDVFVPAESIGGDDGLEGSALVGGIGGVGGEASVVEIEEGIGDDFGFLTAPHADEDGLGNGFSVLAFEFDVIEDVDVVFDGVGNVNVGFDVQARGERFGEAGGCEGFLGFLGFEHGEALLKGLCGEEFLEDGESENAG